MRSCPDRRKCFNCNLPGHIARDCPDKEDYNTDQTDEGDDDDDDEVETMSGENVQADSDADETDSELVIDETPSKVSEL